MRRDIGPDRHVRDILAGIVKNGTRETVALAPAIGGTRSLAFLQTGALERAIAFVDVVVQTVQRLCGCAESKWNGPLDSEISIPYDSLLMPSGGSPRQTSCRMKQRNHAISQGDPKHPR